ncbi:AMP-dependent synthetase/ligase [Thiohalobacter thiocyanaticus]|uniref:Long-chain fatty acid--CoA ligase n=1 Tax=Thiohalobacter thiocyanaticus TaxID=585455 RepID=A0A426QIU3_9GAMM|nr:AMP-dependent synthetase/ligase [Thiohalobacter thiocyanaticus]RRQ21668.1 long-chain fatty acid--CoA ligase [Thiohalobacter thiocyanaticus]
MSSEDLISVEAASTLDGLFRERVRRSPEAPAYRCFSRSEEGWRTLNWRDMAARVARWQQALAGEGLSPGDRVAILLRNGPDWAAFDIAALSLGLVVVPLYVDDRPDNAAYILNDAWCRLLLVQSAGHWRRLDEALSKAEQLTRVVILEGEVEDTEAGRLAALHDWLPQAAEPLPPAAHDGQALASIVYTSGTTGRPKGVMLSHSNMLSVAHAVLTMIDVYPEDEFVSFLPLSHTLERTGGYYLPMMAGATVSYARSVAQLAEDLTQLRPTILIAVPRIFERVYGRIHDQLHQGGALRRGLFKLTVRTGWRRFERTQGRARWSPSLLLWPLLRRLVADKVLAKLGGRLRAAVSGGAAIPEPVSRLFIGLGLPLLQGYGLTESSPVISVNTFQDNDPASVGIPIRGTEVKIGPGDELLARGPGIMLGYWNNHTATREMIDAGGWLHTGDQARIEHGHIYITGRLKDILVMSNGEKVPPADMEAAIMLDPLFDQALVVGEGRPFLTALIVPDTQHWFGFVRELGLDPYDRAHLENEKLEVRVIQRIRAQLHDFPGYAKIRRVALTLDPWTLDEGLVTPTMKIKRAKVLAQYADRIAALYE